MKRLLITLALTFATIISILAATYKIDKFSMRTMLDNGTWSSWEFNKSSAKTIEINDDGGYIELISDDSYIFQIISVKKTKDMDGIVEKTYECSDNEAEDCIIRSVRDRKTNSTTVYVEYPTTQYRYN